jgi:phage protein D
MASPTFVLMIENKPLDNELLSRLLSWEYEDYEKVDKLTLTFNNLDLAITDREEFEQGKIISFRHGYVDSLSGWKYFNLGKVEGWKEIRIEALEIIRVFNTEPKESQWENATLDDVVGSIAKDNGLKYVTEERYDSTGVVIRNDFSQPHVEDLSHLYTLGRKIGYEVWIEEDILYFLPRKYWQTPYMIFTYNGLDGNVLDFNPKVNTMNRKGKFSGGGIDLEKKQQFFYTENGETKRVVYLGKHFWDSDKIQRRHKKLEEARLVRVPMRNKKEAEDILAGKWVEEMSDQITAELSVVGEPNLFARRVIYVDNVGKYSGKYYVKRVHHSSEGGYVSVADLTRNSAFDVGEKYSLTNAAETVNKERPSAREFLEAAQKTPKGKYYTRLFGI